MKHITSAVSILTLGALLGTVGCSSSNNPATNQTPAGGSNGTGGESSTPATGGAPTAATTTATDTSTATSTGGSPSTSAPTGGSPSTSAPTGGATAAPATGGSPSTDGGASSTAGGSTSTSTSAGSCENTLYTPMCGANSTGTTIAKNVACTATDPQLCYKSCGPQNIGFKSETCTNGLYAEEPSGPPCHFNTGAGCDYSCYKVPTTEPAVCPATAPKHGTACTIDPCIVCGKTAGYLDSSDNPKVGLCVCLPAVGTATQKWSCATYPSAWPCGSLNNGPGCT